MSKPTDRPYMCETQHPPMILALIVWILSCLFYFYEFLLQVSPNVMSPELMHDFSLTSESLGILSGIYFYSYAAMQLPGGILMDRFGPHRLLTIATTICALSTICFALTHSYVAACATRLMMGFGSSVAVVGILKLSANWFRPQRFALLTGVMVTIGMLGAISGQAPLAVLIDHFGWRHSMMIMGGIGVILALLILFIVKDAPKHNPYGLPPHDHAEEYSLIKSLLTLIKNKQLWLVAIYGGLMYMSTPVFCGLWGGLYLMAKLHISKTAAANYSSWILWGWVIASPCWGYFSNRIGKRKPALYIGSTGALISSLLFLFAPIPAGGFMIFLLFMFGVFSAGFLPSFAVAKELCNKHYVATCLSFMNMMNMIGVAIAQPLIGWVLEKLWTGELVQHVPVYPLSAYYSAIAILPIGIFIALLLIPFIKETYCQSVYDHH